MTCLFPFPDQRFPSELLQDTIDALIGSAYSANTWRDNNQARINFLFFLHSHRLLNIPHRWSLVRTLPSEITSTIWTAYHAFLYRANYRWHTILGYTGKTRRWLIGQGYSDPTMSDGLPDPVFWALFRSIKNHLHGSKKERYPITFDLLTQLYFRCTTLQDKDGNPIVGLDRILANNLWACFSIMFHGLLRTSELNSKVKAFNMDTECSRSDVSLTARGSSDQYLEVNIKTSKTNPDPTRHGFSLVLHPTGKALCPVAAVKRLWVDNASTSADRPFLDYRSLKERKSNKKPRSDRGVLTRWISTLLKASGINDQRELKKWTTHSFRSGAACELAKQGLSEVLIRMAGRWKSDAVRTYIESVARNPESAKHITMMLANSALAHFSSSF